MQSRVRGLTLVFRICSQQGKKRSQLVFPEVNWENLAVNWTALAFKVENSS